MSSIFRYRAVVLAVAALLVTADAALAQGRGRGRPSFPPGLHDRTLPPGRPFSPPHEFNPPGRSRFGDDEDMDVVVSRLTALLDDRAFPEGGTLPQAVDAYNVVVMKLATDAALRPPAILLAAQQILPRALGLPDARTAFVRVASIDPGAVERSDVPGLLPGGTVQLAPPMARPWTMPGMSAATPIGFGAEWGQVWAGASYQPKVRYNDGQDGAVAVGFGAGNARETVGLQVGIISFSTVDSGFGERMAVDLQLHRSIGDVWGVAVGWESIGAAYDVSRDSGKNLYAVGSRWLQFRDDPDAPFGMGMVSVGVGTGRFQLEEDFYARADGVGLFGSLGVRVLRPVSVVAEWTGQDLVLATSVTPFRTAGVTLTAGFTEITGAAGDGARFMVGGSMGYSFR